MRHLNDELIQKYLDSIETINKTEFESHLVVCHMCREKFEQFQELYKELSFDDVPLPSDSFNFSVMGAVERLESEKRTKKLVTIFGAFSGAALILITLSWMKIITWTGAIASVSGVSSVFLSPLYDVGTLVVEKLNGNLPLVVFAILALTLFQMLDYGLVRHKTDGA